MKIISWLLSSLSACALSVALAQPMLIEGEDQKESIGTWQATFKDYSKQSAAKRAEIQASASKFAYRFPQLLMETPEYQTERAFTDALSRKLDDLMEAMVNGQMSKEAARAEIDGLADEAKSVGDGDTKKLGRESVQQFIQVIQSGLKDRDESVRKATQATLLALTRDKYIPSRSTFRRRCGMRSDVSVYGDLIVYPLSDLIRDQARLQPHIFLKALELKNDAIDSIFLVLAEANTPGVRAMMVDRARRGDRLGLEALINWPVPEGLDIVINRYRTGVTDDEDVFETALLVYGERGLRKLAPFWSSLPESSRYLAYRAMEDLPCEAALNLLQRDTGDKRANIREESAEQLGYLLRAEWYEWYAGPDPRNMDQERALRLLKVLARDPDPHVREKASGYLED